MNQLGHRSKIYELSEMALLFVTGIYVFVVDITKTTMKLEVPDHWERYLIMLIAPVAAARLALFLINETGREQRKKWLRYILVGLLIAAVYYMVFREGKYKTAAFLAVFTIGTIGMDYIKILKAYIVAATTVIFSAILMAWSGVIENFVFFREYTLRSSWGIKYPTDLTSLLFFLILACWVVFRKESSIQFIIPGCLLFVIAYFITDSRTGILCSIALIITIILDLMLSKSDNPILHKTISIAACVAFPVFTIVTNVLVLAYKSGLPFTARINELSSDRLALSVNALNEHGIHLFGSKVEQVGWGGSTFDKPDYNFIDISYIYLLIAYGVIALIMINVLWVLMTRKAVKTGDSRLALALALIAFNCATEHHIVQLNYNLIMAIPLAVLAYEPAMATKEKEAAEDLQTSAAIKKALLAAASSVVILAIVIGMLPGLRTLNDILEYNDSVEGRRILLVIFALATWLIIASMYSLFKVCDSIIKHNIKTGNNRKYVCVLACCASIVLVCVLAGDRVINKNAGLYDKLLDSERNIIEEVKSAGSGRLYACDIPSIYSDKFSGMKSLLFYGEELSRYDDASVIMDAETDSVPLFKKGFLYTQISERHALFTKDKAVVEKLTQQGQLFTAYMPVKIAVDMKDEAERNELEQNEDGSITLHGEDEKLSKGPRKGLRPGRYTVTYDLKLEDATSHLKDEPICRLKVTYYKGEYTVIEKELTTSEFTKGGKLEAKLICDMPDAANVDLKVLPVGDSTISVSRITYQKTPTYDTRREYDKNGNITHECYYGSDGKQYLGTWRYFAKDLQYDNNGNVVKEIYYDSDGNRTANSSGYAELRREFNDNNQDIRDRYYDVSGKPVLNVNGHATTEFIYNEKGLLIESRYYDLQDKPAIVGGETWGGYSILRRNYDDDDRLIKEEFLDAEGNAVIAREGFASKEYALDENGNRVAELYYDESGNKKKNTYGYCELRREFNKDNLNLRDTYYNENGERIKHRDGHASIKYKYDENKRVIEISYYDLNDAPCMTTTDTGGVYHEIKRSYDNLGRVSRDDYYDTMGNPVAPRNGYSARVPVYEGDTYYVVDYRYYDSEGREVRAELGEPNAA